MHAVMPAHVDAGEDGVGQGQGRAFHRVRRAEEREDGTMVVGIGVDVEQSRVERAPDRLDDQPVPPLRDVRNSEEGQGHAPEA